MNNQEEWIYKKDYRIWKVLYKLEAQNLMNSKIRIKDSEMKIWNY